MGIEKIKNLLKEVDNEIITTLENFPTDDTIEHLLDIRDLITEALRICYEKLR